MVLSSALEWPSGHLAQDAHASDILDLNNQACFWCFSTILEINKASQEIIKMTQTIKMTEETVWQKFPAFAVCPTSFLLTCDIKKWVMSKKFSAVCSGLPTNSHHLFTRSES